MKEILFSFFVLITVLHVSSSAHSESVCRGIIAQGESPSALINFYKTSKAEDAKAALNNIKLLGKQKLNNLNFWPIIRQQVLKLSKEDILEASKNSRSLAEVKLIAEPKESLALKLHLIDNAKYSISISQYIFLKDEVSYAILGAMKNAIERGVNVRVLVDSHGSFHHDHPNLKALLGRKFDSIGLARKKFNNRVEIVAFHPFFNISSMVKGLFAKIANIFLPEHLHYNTQGSNLNHRTHDKILMVDESTQFAQALLGGRGIDNKFYDYPEKESQSWIDLEVLVKNPETIGNSSESALTGAVSYFNRLIYQRSNKFLDNSFFGYFGTLTNKTVDTEFQRMEAAYIEAKRHVEALDIRLPKDYKASDFERQYVGFHHELQNIFRKNYFKFESRVIDWLNRKNPNSILKFLNQTLNKAKKDIVIISPYVHLTKSEMNYLTKWLEEDASRRLTIITNSIVTTDAFMTQVYPEYVLGPYFKNNPNIADQVNLHLYGRIDDKRFGGNITYGRLHAKAIIADNNFGAVMSYNFDYRSRNLSSESMFSFMAPNGSDTSKTVLLLKNYAQALIKDSHLWGSKEHKATRTHKASQFIIFLEDLYFKFLRHLSAKIEGSV